MFVILDFRKSFMPIVPVSVMPNILLAMII